MLLKLFFKVSKSWKNKVIFGVKLTMGIIAGEHNEFCIEKEIF